MHKKRILIVSRSFFPINSPRSFRTTELAKEFARQGHEVTVLTPKTSEHISFSKENNIVIKDLGMQTWKPIYLKGTGLALLMRRAIRRLTKLLFEYPDIELMGMVKRALKKENGYDMLISIAVPYPIHWGVARVWRRSGKNNPARLWIADCGDPYMGQENDSFKAPFYFKFVEKWTFRKTDYITVPTEGAREAYYPEFHSKIKVIPQGFRFEDILIEKKLKNNSIPTFAYAGGFIPGRRDPSELLEFLINWEQDYCFHIYTKSSALVKPFIKKGRGRIILHEFIPRIELLLKLSQMDFVVNFENIGNKQTPSKIIDYAIIKKPILSIKTGSLDIAIVEEFLQGNFNNAYIVENIDQYRIENIISEFLKLAK